MSINNHRQAIREALLGQSDPLREIPAVRLDWSGTGTILHLFERTSGKDRENFIEAVGRVIEEHALSPTALAELVQIAASLDLAEVEPQVRKLRSQDIATQKDLKRAITNYLGLRKFAAQAAATNAPHPTNGDSEGFQGMRKGSAAPQKTARK